MKHKRYYKTQKDTIKHKRYYKTQKDTMKHEEMIQYNNKKYNIIQKDKKQQKDTIQQEKIL